MLSVLRFTDSDHPFGIFKLFFCWVLFPYESFNVRTAHTFLVKKKIRCQWYYTLLFWSQLTFFMYHIFTEHLAVLQILSLRRLLGDLYRQAIFLLSIYCVSRSDNYHLQLLLHYLRWCWRTENYSKIQITFQRYNNGSNHYFVILNLMDVVWRLRVRHLSVYKVGIRDQLNVQSD